MKRTHRALAALAIVALGACAPDATENPTELRIERPRADVTPVGPRLVITEVQGNPAGGEVNGAGEWFEVFNAGDAAFPAQTVVVSTITGSGGVESVNVAVTSIDPGAYAVFARSAATADVPTAAIRFLYGTISLNNANTEFVRIVDAGGAPVDSVAYSKRTAGGAITAPSLSPVDGFSRMQRDVNGNGLYDGDENANGVCDATEDGRIMANNTFWETPAATQTYANGANKGTPGTGPFTAGGAPCGGPVGPVATVEVTPSPTSVTVNGTRQLTATGRDAGGTVSPTTFTWTSSNPAIAAVNSAGLVTGVAEGLGVLISATSANGIADTATVDVVPPSVGSLNVFIPSDNHVPVGFVKRALVDVFDTNGVRLSNAGIVFSLTNPSVGTIDQRGYVMGVAEGVTYIKVQAPNGLVDSTFFQITPATAPTGAVYRNHVEFGVPTDANPSDDIAIARAQFASSHNALRGGPNWVAWNLNATHFGAVDRCDCFTPDPQLPLGVYRVEDFDYVGSGYSRGHMTMSANRTTTEQENAATFYFTNVLPQSTDNNSGPWLKLETELNNRARDQGKEIYIIAGGLYRPVPPTLKGEGKIAVPDYTWKIAVIMNAGAGLGQATSLNALEVIAIKVPNDTTAGSPASSVGIAGHPWQNYQTTVNVLEAETGYDFLALLQDNLERIIEANDHPPTARITGSNGGVEGQSLSFDGSTSTDPDGDAITYAWSFGDGATATGSATTHTYSDNGSYQVTLTVTDPLGADHSTSRTVTVTNAAPVLTSTEVPTTPIEQGTPLLVQANYTDAGSADTHELIVDWGDGATSTVAGVSGLATAAHAYDASGLFTITLRIRDDDGGLSAIATSALVPVNAAGANVTAGGTFQVGNDRATLGLTMRNVEGTLRGNLDLHLTRADLRFATDHLDVLVVAGNQATLRVRTLEKATGEAYTVTLVFEANSDSQGDKSRVRLIVQDAAGTVVIDTQTSDPLTAAPTTRFQGQAQVH